MIKVLIVEDEKPIREMIRLCLSQAGYDCTCAADGESACNLFENNVYDLALLDIMLPKVNGYEILEYINPLGIPTIFITAKSQTGDKVRGLKGGAEDYIVKPFVVAELLARIEVVLRRYNKIESILEYDEYKIDVSARKVYKSEKIVALTSKEFDVFKLLVQNKGKILFRDYVYQVIWEAEPQNETRTLNLHMQRIRKKLALGNRLRSVYGMGYRLD